MYKNILIYNSGGGLGDSIQLFPLILSLKNHFMQSNFHYLGAHENHFTAALRDYKISIKTNAYVKSLRVYTQPPYWIKKMVRIGITI